MSNKQHLTQSEWQSSLHKISYNYVLGGIT
jgi:hypothetical protein